MHMARYHFTIPYITDKIVLDAGCGSGYGAFFMVVNGAKKVVGVDISESTIKYAKKHFIHDNLEFQIMDCTNLKFPEKCFDVVTSFEVIEHIPNYDIYLSEIKRVLALNGIAIFSTPNKKDTLEKKKPINPSHFKEFYPYEFKCILKKYFQNVELWGESTIGYDTWYSDPIKSCITKTLRSKLLYPLEYWSRSHIPSNIKNIIGRKIGYPGYKYNYIISKKNIINSISIIAICTRSKYDEI